MAKKMDREFVWLVCTETGHRLPHQHRVKQHRRKVGGFRVLLPRKHTLHKISRGTSTARDHVRGWTPVAQLAAAAPNPQVGVRVLLACS